MAVVGNAPGHRSCALRLNGRAIVMTGALNRVLKSNVAFGVSTVLLLPLIAHRSMKRSRGYASDSASSRGDEP